MYFYICAVHFKVDFIFNTEYRITDCVLYKAWLKKCALYYGLSSCRLVYSFMNDNSLLEINKKHLSHDAYTDIITFCSSEGKNVIADIAISTERAEENAHKYDVHPENEILRLMAHGLLHCVGFKDKNKSDKRRMTAEENKLIKMFHVEQKTRLDV